MSFALTSHPVVVAVVDAARMREALADLGRRRLARTISETEFGVERALIFGPYDRVPPSHTLPRKRALLAQHRPQSLERESRRRPRHAYRSVANQLSQKEDTP